MSDLAFDRRAKRMGDFDDFLRFRDVLVVGLRRGIVHNGREAKLQRLHRLPESETVVIVDNNRNRRALRRGDKRGRDERKVAVGQKHLGSADDNRAARLFGRRNRGFEHIGVVRVEKPNGVLFRLCLFKNLV